jgi:hypothetical protein
LAPQPVFVADPDFAAVVGKLVSEFKAYAFVAADAEEMLTLERQFIATSIHTLMRKTDFKLTCPPNGFAYLFYCPPPNGFCMPVLA